MDPFLVLGVIGLLLIVATLLFGDVLDGLTDAIDLGSGLFSAPVIGGFLAAFGFIAALTNPLVGVAAGVGLGAAAAALTRSVMRMRTDPTPRTADLVGRSGVLVSPVPAGGYGRVRVSGHGQQILLNATGDHAMDAGTRVVVVQVTSATAVFVSPLELQPPPRQDPA